ncbi:PP0621 family protein [Helicobacter sp. 11S03491-1]|uniref:PP0621 family protein n=1 Tax=Helicobacter sp. 11S03491-1 TaxID=1476196 RepID=UPI0021516EDC|nr:PP0621 family protein [Helicobacter sp. 11S03491-1]
MRFLILILIIGGIVWYFFLRKSPKKPKNNHEAELMLECCECGTYVSSKEAISYNDKYFCSKKCLLKNKKG